MELRKHEDKTHYRGQHLGEFAEQPLKMVEIQYRQLCRRFQ